MPLKFLIAFVVIAILAWALVFFVIQYAEKKEKVITIAVLSTITILVGAGMVWYFSVTAAGRRAWKTQESNFTGGINREVKVYSADGKLIQEYKGKIDIEYDDDRILFDDEKGLRHIIYYPTGTVTVDEVEE